MEWSAMRLTIEGIDVQRGGERYVYLFFKEGFPIKHEKAVKKYRFAARQPSHELFVMVPDRPFALKVHHDEDGSGAVTKNRTGIIPAEGLGFSAGAKLRFAPPSFKGAMMTKPASGESTLTVIYP